jgi:hypothetical protein
MYYLLLEQEAYWDDLDGEDDTEDDGCRIEYLRRLMKFAIKT